MKDKVGVCCLDECCLIGFEKLQGKEKDYVTRKSQESVAVV